MSREEVVDLEAEEGRVAGGVVKFRLYHWVLIGAIDVLGPISTDAYIVMTSTVRHELQTSNIMVALSLQLNWLAKGLATLWIGALSDKKRYGRVGALNRSFLFYVIGTGSCALTATHSYGIYTLLIGRTIQGIGESGTTVCTAVSRDVLEDPRTRLRVISILSSLRLLAIAISPTIGGFVGVTFGWRALFAGLTLSGIVLALLTYCTLPETLATSGHDDDDATQSKQCTYLDVCRRLRYTKHNAALSAARGALIAMTSGYSGLLCYLSAVSQLLQDKYNVSTLSSALYMGCIALTFLLVNAVLAFLLAAYKNSPYLSPLNILKFSLTLRLFSSVYTLISAFGPCSLRDSPLALLLNCVYLSFSIACGFGAASTIFIQPFGDVAGKASGLALILRTVVATSISQLAIDITQVFGVSGFLCFVGLVHFVSQFAWFFLPASHSEMRSSDCSSITTTDTEPNHTRGIVSFREADSNEDSGSSSLAAPLLNSIHNADSQEDRS